MKYLLSFLLALFLLAPHTSYAALDCVNNPNDYSCMCYGDIGGVFTESGSYEDINSSSDAECADSCAALNANSYQFSECAPNGDTATEGNTSLENTGVYSACDPLPQNYTCTCEFSQGQISGDQHVGTMQACTDACALLRAPVHEFTCKNADQVDEPADLASTLAPKRNPIIPNLNVNIPGLDFGSAIFQDSATGTVSSNLLGLYIQAVYRFLLVFMSVVAVVMLMIGGLEYVIAGGSAKRVERAKSRIKNAIIGLILLFAAYDIAFLLNPETVTFQSLSLIDVRGEYLSPPEEEDSNATPNASITGEFAPVSGTHIINRTGADLNLDPDVGPELVAAADAFFAATGKNVVITSADRDIRHQATLFYNNCLAHGGNCSVPTCNPADSSVVKRSGSRYSLVGDLAGLTNAEQIITGLVTHANLGNCPHTSRVAVDAWCEGQSHPFTVDVDCQVQLMQAMINAGFCRLGAEVWHFEDFNKRVSVSNCQTGNITASYKRGGVTYTPPSTCQRWNFRDHICVTDKPE